MNGHNVVGFKVRVRQLDQRVDVVLVGVHLVLVDGPDVPGAAVSQGERPHTQRAFVGFDAGVSLPVSPGEEREGISWQLAVRKSPKGYLILKDATTTSKQSLLNLTFSHT